MWWSAVRLGAVRQREPRQRDQPYMLWIKSLPCVACAVAGRTNAPTEAAHCKLAIAAHGWREGGGGEKIHDRRCLPLCPEHHRGKSGEHLNGQRAFWDSLGICPACLALGLSAAYDAMGSGTAVIWAAVRTRRRDGLPTC